MKILLLLSLILTFATACSTPKEKLEKRQAEAKEEYKESMKEAQEEYRKDNKDEAIEMIEDSDGVQVDKDGNQINIDN